MALGQDQVQVFRVKHFSVIHKGNCRQIQDVLTHEERIP